MVIKNEMKNKLVLMLQCTTDLVEKQIVKIGNQMMDD